MSLSANKKFNINTFEVLPGDIIEVDVHGKRPDGTDWEGVADIHHCGFMGRGRPVFYVEHFDEADKYLHSEMYIPQAGQIRSGRWIDIRLNVVFDDEFGRVSVSFIWKGAMRVDHELIKRSFLHPERNPCRLVGD
jgi:hypothetical protein